MQQNGTGQNASGNRGGQEDAKVGRVLEKGRRWNGEDVDGGMVDYFRAKRFLGTNMAGWPRGACAASNEKSQNAQEWQRAVGGGRSNPCHQSMTMT
jgi:hypothetical protein